MGRAGAGPVATVNGYGRFLNLLFPGDLYCLSCGRPLPGGQFLRLTEPSGAGTATPAEAFRLCGYCFAELPWVQGRTCARCGKPLAPENPKPVCRDCAEAEHLFGQGYACVSYTGRAAELVRDLKYRERPYIADTLGGMMARRFLEFADPETGELPCYDFVCAAPMHARKRAARGFDQAELLARGFARRSGLPYFPGLLARIHETDVMSGLSRDKRLRNLSGEISLRSDARAAGIAGKRALIVDDIFTTGSTADACAEALLEGGAATADFFAFAIGADGRRAAASQ